MSLSFANVANILVKMRRHAKRAQENHLLTFESGEPATHDTLIDDTFLQSKLPITRSEIYTCTGAVDSAKLLRGTRHAVLSTVATVGANALVDEQWTCTICASKKRVRDDDTYVVYVKYSAKATVSEQKDPQKPVHLEKAKRIPGLMTVRKREIR